MSLAPARKLHPLVVTNIETIACYAVAIFLLGVTTGLILPLVFK